MNINGLYAASGLVGFAAEALEAVGLAPRFCGIVAEILVEGDLMGHDTHGLALLPAYLGSIRSGGMTPEGAPEILNEKPAAALWDGRLLPGPWLITEGLKKAVEGAATYGTYTLNIRRSHHTAALTAYLKPVTDRGMVAILAVSDPTEACVAPFGGREPVLSTDPMAIGIPGDDGPILIDMATSETTNGMVNRLARAGAQFGHDALISATGAPSRDPAVRSATPPGAILPLGGVNSGHKGTGLGVIVEALSHGLSGRGRRFTPEGWEANVFLQVIDPEAFGGVDAFTAETGFLARAVRAAAPADPEHPVRLPGDRALARRAERLRSGVPLSAGIVSGLAEWAEKLGLALPMPETEA